MVVQYAELMINTVIVLLSYAVCIPLIGYARAATTSAMGDSTPESMGFLTLDPFAHLSTIWIVLIVFFQIMFGYTPFGFGRYIPINPLNIQGNHRGLKLAAAYFADTAAALAIACLSFFSLFVIHGNKALFFARNTISFKTLSMLGSDVSSLVMIVSWLLFTLFSMATIIAAFSAIFNFVYFACFYIFESYMQENSYADMVLMFAPLFLLLLFVSHVRVMIMQAAIYGAHFLSFIIGLIH